MEKQIYFATRAIVLNKDKDILLIIKSSLEDVTPNTVDIPGGRLEYGEHPEECMVREVKEEAGLDVKIIAPIGTWKYIGKDFQLAGVTFLTEAVGGKVRLSDEHESYMWEKPEDILKSDKCPEWIKKNIREYYTYINRSN